MNTITSAWASSLSWWGNLRSTPPVCISRDSPNILLAITEHSICQPGRPCNTWALGYTLYNTWSLKMATHISYKTCKIATESKGLINLFFKSENNFSVTLDEGQGHPNYYHAWEGLMHKWIWTVKWCFGEVKIGEHGNTQVGRVLHKTHHHITLIMNVSAVYYKIPNKNKMTGYDHLTLNAHNASPWPPSEKPQCCHVMLIDHWRTVIIRVLMKIMLRLGI